MSQLKHEFQARVPSFNFVYNKLQCFQRFLRRKKKHKEFILVLNLVEISKEFLSFIDLKITETRLTTIQIPFVSFEYKQFVRSIRATRARKDFKLCAHLLSIYEYLVNQSISVVVLRACIRFK